MRELADKAFVSYSYIRAIERGLKPVNRVDLVDHLADALGVTRDELLDGDQPPEPTVEERVATIIERSAAALSGVPILYLGRVPADQPRPVDDIGKGPTVPVPLEWVGKRSHDDLFVVRASGNCMMRRGIIDGSYVLCELARGREPRNGQLVAVWVNGERSLKLWYRAGEDIELHDGEGQCIARYTIHDDIVVVGFWVADWRTADDIEPIG